MFIHMAYYWDSSKEIPIPALAMRQPRIVFNLVEINPFEKVRGSLKNNVGNIVKAIEFCTRINNPVTCKRNPSQNHPTQNTT